MRKLHIITLFAAFVLAPSLQAASDTGDSTENSYKDTAGLGIGALVGGVLGGPVGAVVGAAGGSWLGSREAGRDRQREALHADLTRREAELEQLRGRLAELESRELADGNLRTVHLKRDSDATDITSLSRAINLAVYFRTDSSELTPAASERVTRLAAYLAEYPDVRIHVAGHADRRGPPDYNRELSQRRAASVAALLEQAGVNRERLHLEAHGENKAQAGPGDREGYAFDRRVSIALSHADPV